MASNEQMEKDIVAAGANKGPRITPDIIEARIASEHYFTALDGACFSKRNSYAGDWEVPRSHDALDLLTICVLVLRNGFTVTGESACASPENFNAEIGQKIARQNAVAKIWALEGYVLKNKLSFAQPG